MAAAAIPCQKLLMKPDTSELLGCGEVLPDPGWRLPPHLHPFHELIVVKRGAMILRTSRVEVRVSAGDCLFYAAGLVHEEVSDPDDPVNTIFMAFRTAEPAASIPLHMQDREGRLAELLSWLIRDRRQQRAAGDCLPLVGAIVQELRWLLTRPRDPWLEQTREYLRRRMAERVSIAEMAAHGRMSRFAFIRKFKRLAGRTPMDELRQMRLHEARNLILTRDWPLKAIAPAVGIGDECQLSKLFRRHFGISPGQMRQSSEDRVA